MSITLSALQQQRRDTAANWTSANPTLLAGEWGYETDTGKWKVGDGSTTWTTLAYVAIPDNNGLIPIDQLLLPAGTAAAPSLTFTGDLNTGIYHSAADTLAFSTAGTGRLFIDSSGNIGIGISSPSNALNVVGSSATTNTGATVLVDDSASLAANIGGSIAFRGTDGTNTRTYGLIRGGKLDSSSGSFDGYLAFETRSNGQATTSEHLRITNAGNVGIGTTVPNEKLVVSGNASVTGALQITSNTSAPAAGAFVFRPASNTLAFGSNSAERMRIDSSGRVGIGTSAPQGKLQVYTSSLNSSTQYYGQNFGIVVETENQDALGDEGNGICFTQQYTTDASDSSKVRTGAIIGFKDAASGGFGGGLKFKVQPSGANPLSTSMTLKANGNVGIGVTPAAGRRLHVSGVGTLVQFDSSNTSNLIKFTNSAASGGFLGYQSDNLVFYTGNTERLRIDSSGNVGIGTSSPSEELEVVGDIKFGSGSNTWLSSTNVLKSSNSQGAFLRAFVSTAANPTYAQVGDENTGVFFPAADTLGVTTGGTERLRIDSSGRVGIGNSSPTQELCVRSTAGTEADILIEGNNGASGGLTVFHNASDCGLWNSSSTSMRFATNNTERLRIDSSGRVGIGESSPVVDLEIGRPKSTNQIRLNPSDGNVDLRINPAFGGSDLASVSVASNHPLAFHTSNTERLRIDSSGRVGVGVSSPVGPFHLVGDTSADVAGEYSILNVSDTSDTTKALRLAYDDVNDCGVVSASDRGAGWKNVVISPSGGNLGIGTSSPQRVLHVKDSNPSVWVQPDADTEICYYSFVNTSGSIRGYVAYDISTENMFFRTNGAERVRINGQGNVGIRTSAPSYALDINSGDANAVRIRGTADNPLIMDATDSGPSYVSVQRAGTRVAYYGFGGSGNDFNIFNDTSTGDITFGTNGTERLRIADAGQIGLGGANYGTSGQVLTSNGSGSAPTWQNAGGSALSTAVTLSSNASVTFTDVPSWAGKIIVMLGDVDTSASQHLRVRLGTSGGVISTGYVQSSHNDGGGSSAPGTDGFYWFNNDTNSGFGGLMTITKLSSTEYCQSHAGRFSDNGGNHGGGYLSGVSGTIDRVEISIVSGTMTSGRINLRYEP